VARDFVTTGNPYDTAIGRSAAVRVGNLILVSGQASVDDHGEPVADASFAAHYERAFANFIAAVEAAGGTHNDVVSVHTFVTEPPPATDAETVARLHHAAVGSGPNRPASTLACVSALAVRGAKVQVCGIAVVDQDLP
jgi:enamine deaminase RidA (YjgF/YER057c/UK114 family)